jgi:hypothetical protein
VGIALQTAELKFLLQGFCFVQASLEPVKPAILDLQAAPESLAVSEAKLRQSNMSLHALPLTVINMGVECLFVLDQRLVAQVLEAPPGWARCEDCAGAGRLCVAAATQSHMLQCIALRRCLGDERGSFLWLAGHWSCHHATCTQDIARDKAVKVLRDIAAVIFQEDNIEQLFLPAVGRRATRGRLWGVMRNCLCQLGSELPWAFTLLWSL